MDCYRIVDDKTNWSWQFFSHHILKAEDKIREGIEPLSKAANLFVKLKRYIEFKACVAACPRTRVNHLYSRASAMQAKNLFFSVVEGDGGTIRKSRMSPRHIFRRAMTAAMNQRALVEFILFCWREIGEQLEIQECLLGISLADLWQLPWPKERWLLV